MDSVLIVCSDYYSEIDAGGICIRNITKEFNNRNKKVFIITEAKNDGCIERSKKLEVWGVKKTWFSLLSQKLQHTHGISSVCYKVIRILRGIFVTLLYPNVSPIRSKKIEKLADQIIRKNNVKVLIGAYRPYESIDAAIRIKNKYKNNIKCFTYHLDLISSPNTNSSLLYKYKKMRGKAALKKEYGIVDYLILPESGRGLLQCEEKILYADFPLYIDDGVMEKNNFEYDKDYINIAYIGTIDGKNREISTIGNLLNLLNENKKVKLHIWGALLDTNSEKIAKENSYIEYHGMVENKYTRYLLSEADLCLNLSNKITYTMIPSKIFQLFSVGNPIINIVESRKDKSLSYFEEYGNVFNIDINQKNNAIMLKLEKFINHSLESGKKQNQCGFEKSRPSFTVNLILEKSRYKR